MAHTLFSIHRMTKSKLIIVLFFFVLFVLSGFSLPSEGDKIVKTIYIDTTNLYRRVALPDKAFDAEKIKTVDKYFIARSVKGQFNGVVLFAQDDKIFMKAYGYSNFRSKEKLTVSSRFQLASISKTITSTAVLMLAREGKIDLKTPVNQYLEGFGRPGITVEMLLTHTSGLPDYTRFTAAPWGSTDPMGNEDMLAIMIKKKPASVFSPGRQYQYCNTNYALLASIVEHVTGEGFAPWVRKNIFEPVGMKHTFFCTEEQFHTSEQMTTGYTSRRAPYSLNFLDGVLGDKGVYSTVQDMLCFDLALRNGFLLPPEWQQKAYTNYTDQIHPYGYGWRLYEYQGHEIVYHNGWWHGYRGRFLRVPKENMTIVILENQARNSFSVPTLMNISQKLFDEKVADTTIVESGEEDTDGQ